MIVLDGAGCVACVEEESGLFLPGGGIEAGEDALAAAHREVAEECARELLAPEPIASAVQFHLNPREGGIELQATFFAGQFGRSLDREAEHALRWLPVDPVPGFYHDAHAFGLRRALERAARPSGRG